MSNKEIQLGDLIGTHTLQGIEVGSREFADCFGHIEEMGYIKFKLDGLTYMAVEDPDDGYRSYLRDLLVVDEECATKLPDIPVACRWMEDTPGPWGEENEVLIFADAENGKDVLKVGTGNVGDYYPYCVLEYYPENMAINEGVTQ